MKSPIPWTVGQTRIAFRSLINGGICGVILAIAAVALYHAIRTPSAWGATSSTDSSQSPTPSEITEAQLPEDVPAVPEVIHQMKYPMNQSTQMEGGYNYLYGDKFLNTSGFYINGYNYLSEQLALGAGIALYSSSVSDEAQMVAKLGATPTTHNPTFILRTSVLYEPVYGKLAIGSWIQHFRIGIEGGLHAASESVVTGQGASSGNSSSSGGSDILVGPNAALRMTFPFLSRYSATLRGEYLMHGSLQNLDPSSRKYWTGSFGLGYRL